MNIIIARQAVRERQLALALLTKITNAEAIDLARTRILTLAKQGLGRSMKSLLTALKPNPYVLAAAAVAGLAFAVYKLATADSAAEIAAKSLTEAQKKRTQSVEDERSRTEELINKLKDETLTRRERQTILTDLQKNVPLFVR